MQDNVAPVHRLLCRIDNCFKIFENWEAIKNHRITCHPAHHTASAACETVMSEMISLQGKNQLELPKHHGEEQTEKAIQAVQTTAETTTTHATANKVVIKKIITIPKAQGAHQPPAMIPLQHEAGTIFSGHRHTAANLFHPLVIGEPLQVVDNDVLYPEEFNIGEEYYLDDATRPPFTSEPHPETLKPSISGDEKDTKHLLSIVEANKILLQDKLTKSKKVWDHITNMFNQGTGNQLTSKQCCDKYRNMLRSFKIWKTACTATGAATPKKLFYFDYMEDIVGGSHTITTPFLDDSEGSTRAKSAPPNIAPMKRKHSQPHSSCHPTSSREAPSVMVTSNKRPAEAPAAHPHFAKRVMHDHRSVVANQTPVFDFGPQPGPSGLGGRRVECEEQSNIDDYVEVPLEDDPTEEPEGPTKFRKKQLRPKSHNQLIQEYLVKQEERMARQEVQGQRFQEQQLRFFEENSKSMATFNCQMGEWLTILKKKNTKKSKKNRRASSTSSTEDSN